MDDITIRPFMLQDRGLVEEFYQQMGAESRSFFNRGGWNEKRTMGFFLGEPGENLFFLAEIGGKMVGFVFFYHADKCVPWLGIAVREDCKGKGLGKVLMDFARKYAMEHDKGGIMLTTHVANLRGQALYEGGGYQRLGMHTSGEILYMLNFDERRE